MINEEFVKKFSRSNRTFSPTQETPSLESFYFQHMIETDVISALFHVRSNAVGMDRIPLKFIKSICPVIVKPITHLFNVIVYTSQFPKAWKNSKIIPIKKKASLNALSNLRPISILSALSKVFERILKTQMGNFINQHNLITPHQSGFRPKHSTKTAMLKVFDDIGLIVDQRKPVVLILLDFSKAFDTISHNILYNKLRTYFNFSVQAANLIQPYLFQREQIVFNNNAYSTPRSSSGISTGTSFILLVHQRPFAHS